MKRQATALFICLAGLLTLAILHILNENSDRVMRMQAKATAVSWANYVANVTPDIEKVIQTGRPTPAITTKYREASAINHLKQFTILNAVGRPVFELHTKRSGVSNTKPPKDQKNLQTLSYQLVAEMTGSPKSRAAKQIVNSARCPDPA